MAERNILVLPPAVEERTVPSAGALRERATVSEPVPDVIARWVLRIATFVLPLAFLPNLVSEFVLPKILLLRLLLTSLAILLLIRWMLQGAISWRRTPLDLPVLAFAGSAALSTIFSVNQTLAFFGSYDRWEGLLTIVSYALLYFLTVQFLSGRSDARGLTWALLASGYVVGGVAILQSQFGLFGGGYGTVNGQIRADVTLAQPDFTGIFLAMLLPIALSKVVSRRSWSSRLLAASIAVVIALGLLVTYTRGAWIGAAVGSLVVLALRRGRFHPWPVVVGIGLGALLLAGSIAIAGHPSINAPKDFVQAIAARTASITDPNSPAIASRLRIWHDTPAIVADRPLVGSGPDTFGLVSPQHQSAPRQGEYFDRPHMELLGVAAMQGLIGLAAYLWILVTLGLTFWRGRRLPGTVALFSGVVAYQVALQGDFSWTPVTLPYWLLVAAAMTTWAAPSSRRIGSFPRRIAVPAVLAGSAAALVLLVPGVIRPYLADASYFASLNAASLSEARADIAQARTLAPYEVAYATEAGNYALNLDANGNPAANADWPAAREAYETAARLGSFSPEMFQTLAVVDDHLGDHAAALATARHALSLDKYDPYSQRLVATLSGF